MNLRENLREYVWQLSAETAATGMPIVRPMVLQWPLDPVCATPQVEGQFMFGDDWLVAPVTTYQATEWKVYLPGLSANETWAYFFNESVTFSGSAGQWVTVPVSL
jgi:alpha-glucosidase (family GH31 glycosyl hydrolase)